MTILPPEHEAPAEDELIGVPKKETRDYSVKCKAILAGSKMLDLVVIADNSVNIVGKAARSMPQSSTQDNCQRACQDGAAGPHRKGRL